MASSRLFEPMTIGNLTLPNRIVMAPLTRSRANADCVPSEFAAEYYSQRATAGLIIAEATQISAEAQGYSQTPGIYTAEQIVAWRKITQAVHAKGGRIFLQLWHTGRASNAAVQPEGRQPKAPSPIRAEAQTWVEGAFVPCSLPVEMSLDDIKSAVSDFADAAANAISAGFDGVEIHAANGYLIDQFLRDGANKRQDQYGGTIANRVRFMQEVLTAVTARIGSEKVGIRFSPNSTVNGISESDPGPLFKAAIDALRPFNLAYMHLIEGITRIDHQGGAPLDWADLYTRFQGPTIANNGFTRESAMQRVGDNPNQAISFGRNFIANPDLVLKLKEGIPLTAANPETFYGGDQKGYTDYPFYHPKGETRK